jgi:glycosyltransferase involved in cell wall biosynthesis
LIDGYSNNTEKFQEISSFNFLFLARIEKAKGIMEALELFYLIQKANPTKKFNLRIGGNGPYLKQAKQFVLNKSIENVEFLGHIEGKEKRNAFESSHFFLFPSHGEGMPLAVLEAMAFGLPMLVTAVGGLKDIFKDGDMGVLLDSLDMNKAIEALIPLINDENMLIRISNFNYNYSRENFMSSEVANNLDQIILEVYSGTNPQNT